MYLKLAVRNAKRSIIDYFLYIFTMTVLLSIICISNCIALWGDMQANFQTASLPLLIFIIMVFLISYINNFMVKQRVKEFAIYLLLGMKRKKLFLMFTCEILLIGIACFIISIMLGLGIYHLSSGYFGIFGDNRLYPELIGKSTLYSFIYFCMIEIFSIIRIRQTVYKLEINRLMNEKRRNQPLNGRKKAFWLCLFIVSISVSWLMLCGIVILPNGFSLISVVSIPVLCAIFAFYKWLYALLSSIRVEASENLYTGNRLYLIAEMTSGSKTSAGINTIFSICLLFSAVSFIFGTLLLNEHLHLFTHTKQIWMAFLQISICTIFLVIYFSILSMLQIIELKQQANNIKILHYMGKNQSTLERLIRSQILTKLLIPMLMCLIILFSAVPIINLKLNFYLPVLMYNILLKSTAIFMLYFSVLYLCYFYITYLIGKRYVKAINNSVSDG